MKTLVNAFSAVLLLLFCAVPGWAGIADISAAADAQVVEGSPSTNYGGQTSMYVASAGGGAYLDERTWVRFDLAGQLPPGATINTANLRLYCWKADDAGDMEAVVHGSADTAWSENAITWDSQPAFEAAVLGQQTLQAGQSYVWAEWDVTGFVQTRLSGGGTAISFMVKAAVEGQDPWRAFAFNSREYSPALAPRLRIDYTGQWPAGNGFTLFHMNDAHSRLLPHDFDVPRAR